MGLGFMNISYLAFLQFPDHMSDYLIVLRRAGIAFHFSLKFIPRRYAGMLAIWEELSVGGINVLVLAEAERKSASPS